VSTEAKKAYIAQLLKIIEEEPQPKEEAETAPSKKKK